MSVIRFKLNGEWRAESNISPTTTLLDYLRQSARLTGTKEGCGEGDCGACTVVIEVPRDGERKTYHAVNSCLLLVPQVDGLSILTIEGLARADGALHSVQQALIEANATQCGFCTPGFAMAIFAFSQMHAPRTEAHIHEALSGNLCRCTGYRSIVEACHATRSEPPGCGDTDTVPQLSIAEYRLGSQLYLAPHSLEELLDAKSRYPDAILLSGGTDLGLRVSKGHEAFPIVISTARVSQLRAITEGVDTLTIGGAVTYTQALPFLQKYFPRLADLVRRIGSPQIRNMGTLAGNIANASPIGDSIPSMMVLNAALTLRSSRGARVVKADDFFPGYRRTVIANDEVIESVSIPLVGPGTIFATYKVSKRFDQDISTIVGAFRLRVQQGVVTEFRAAYGGMAATVQRAKRVEELITGRPWGRDALTKLDDTIAEDFDPVTDHRGTRMYRLSVAANLMRRMQTETATGAAEQVWEL